MNIGMLFQFFKNVSIFIFYSWYCSPLIHLYISDEMQLAISMTCTAIARMFLSGL
jgi:hypothetical protein